MDDESVGFIKEKLNWKDEFIEQARICRKSIQSSYSKISLEFRIWYYMIPIQLVDENLKEVWEKFNINSKPTDSDEWLSLYNNMWNWAKNNGLVLKQEQGDELQIQWMNLGYMIRTGDSDGLIEWAEV